MTRYIEETPIISYIERLLNIGTGKKKSLEYLKKFVEHQPTADVVEVVRCKDCVHCKVNFLATAAICEKVLHTIENENDFCSYGKKVE